MPIGLQQYCSVTTAELKLLQDRGPLNYSCVTDARARQLAVHLRIASFSPRSIAADAKICVPAGNSILLVPIPMR
jgi:hypothetical protein